MFFLVSKKGGFATIKGEVFHCFFPGVCLALRQYLGKKQFNLEVCHFYFLLKYYWSIFIFLFKMCRLGALSHYSSPDTHQHSSSGVEPFHLGPEVCFVIVEVLQSCSNPTEQGWTATSPRPGSFK